MRRPVTSMDPWQAEQDEHDRVYEHGPVNERPPFPTSPGLCLPSQNSRDEEHCAPSPDDISSCGLGAVVLAVKE